MHKLVLIFYCSLWTLSSLATAQEILKSEATVKDTLYINPREVLSYDTAPRQSSSIDKVALQKFKEDEDFNYKEAIPEDTVWTRFKTWLSNLWNEFISWILGGEEAVGFWALVIKLLPYLGILILLSLLVWVFLKIDSGTLLNERLKAPAVLITDDEELLKNQNLQSLLEQALDAQNYRLAIRYYYLLILQKMSRNELINWQVQKTNQEYIFEIKDQHLRRQFRAITDLYDYIWYGNFEVDASAFAKAEIPFNTLNKKL